MSHTGGGDRMSWAGPPNEEDEAAETVVMSDTLRRRMVEEQGMTPYLAPEREDSALLLIEDAESLPGDIEPQGEHEPSGLWLEVLLVLLVFAMAVGMVMLAALVLWL